MIFSLSNHLHSPCSIPSISSSPPPSPSVEVPLLLLSVSPPRSSSWPSSAISHILCSPKKCNYVVPLPRLRCITESAEETSWSDEETLNGEGEPNEWRRNGKRSSDLALADSQKSNQDFVRENAILLNLGTLRAIAMPERVFIFDYNRKGGKAFLDHLLPRLNPKNMNGAPSMPFELEVVEAALVSRIQRLERKLMDVEPRVVALLEVLPNQLTADVLEELRLSKQTLAEANPNVTAGGARIQLGQ